MDDDGHSDSGRREAETKVDVRAIAVERRHPLVFASFDALREGAALLLVTDHEPRPLRAEFAAARAGRFAWSQARVDDGHWEATIRKLGEAAAGEAAEALRHSGLFAILADTERATLAARARVVSVRRNRAVVEQGVRWPYVAVVAAGTIRAMLVGVDGRELALFELLPGDVAGTTALADGGPSPLRFVAGAAGARVALVPAELVLAQMRRRAEFAEAIHAQNAARFRIAVERFGAQTSQPVAARLADALLAYAAPLAGLAPALDPLPQMRQVDLAALAGTARDVVYRIVGEFEAAGALSREHGRIVLLDRAKLERFARESKS